METQPGHRTTLVDPFGRALEEWLHDAPAVRSPYVSDLVVPPVTGPIQHAGGTNDSVPESPAPALDEGVTVVGDGVAATDQRSGATAGDGLPASAFRRERARHASACAPSFPEPPERLSLSFGDLAVEVSSSNGRSTIERIEFLEGELERRDADLARLAAWEAHVAGSDDPEVTAARAYAAEAFADILAEAMAEAAADERRRARLRAASTPMVRATSPDAAAVSADVRVSVDRDLDASVEARDAGSASPAPVPAVHAGPVPLVQPATGPNAIHRAAFEEAIRVHAGSTADVPVVFPLERARADAETTTGASDESHGAPQPEPTRGSWWSRVVSGLLRMLGRR